MHHGTSRHLTRPGNDEAVTGAGRQRHRCVSLTHDPSVRPDDSFWSQSPIRRLMTAPPIPHHSSSYPSSSRSSAVTPSMRSTRSEGRSPGISAFSRCRTGVSRPERRLLLYLVLYCWPLFSVPSVPFLCAGRWRGSRVKLAVRGREKVSADGQVEVPVFGQLEVPIPCSSCRRGV
jgi:hypothetical protein